MEQKYSHKIASIVLKELGLQPYQVDSLQRVPYEQLFNAGIKAVETTRIEAEQEGFDCFIFGLSPVVDGDVLPTQPFDKQAPEVSRDIPMMIGSTLNEFCKASYVPFFRNLSEEKVMEQINQKFGSRSNDYLQAFAKAYPNYKPQDLIDIDNRFRVFATKQAALKAKQEGAAVYTYLFTWQSPAMDGIYRAYHCMEIPFVFNNVVLQASMTGGGREARVLADKMSRAWINFAHTGNPNAEGLPLWIPYTEKEATMIFDNQCEVKYGFDRELTNILGDFLPLPF